MFLDKATSLEYSRLLEPRKVFQLTPEDRELINLNQDWIINEIKNPKEPIVGKHWKCGLRLTLSRGDDPAVPIIIKQPWGTRPHADLMSYILENEYRVLSKGFTSFIPTYPVGNITETGLFVQYFAIEQLPEYIPYSKLKRDYQAYMATLGLGVKDWENNAIYTEHGWAFPDVEEIV